MQPQCLCLKTLVSKLSEISCNSAGVMLRSEKTCGKIFKNFKHKFNNYFFLKLQSNEFAYLLFPFLRIFKLFGFLPVQLEPLELLNENYKTKIDRTSCVATFFASIIFVVGFYVGAAELAETKVLRRLYETNIISYFTTCGQIAFLFALASYGVIDSWCHLSKMQHLFLWITKIDHQLEKITGRQLNYEKMRQKLFVQLMVVLLVPSCLSMVNCVVINSFLQAPDLLTSCFWFVCFAPFSLLALRQFQFYNLMIILKTKFDMINTELQQYGSDNLLIGGNRGGDRDPINTTKPVCTPDVVRKLQEVYTNAADSVDWLLKMFAGHLMLLTIASFGVITVQGYHLFAAFVLHSMQMGSYQLFIVTGWILVQIVIIGLNVGTCDTTSEAMSLTGLMLHKMKADSLTNTGLYLNVLLFSQEVLHRKRTFTAAGFFDMNYKLITSIIGAVTTYLLIIIQFHVGNIPDNNSCTQHQ